MAKANIMKLSFMTTAKRTEQQVHQAWDADHASALKAHRVELGFTQAEFASLAGIGRRRYSWIEYTNRDGVCPVKPTETEVKGIAEASAHEPKSTK